MFGPMPVRDTPEERLRRSRIREEVMGRPICGEVHPKYMHIICDKPPGHNGPYHHHRLDELLCLAGEV
jgi:hypothetical protein